MTETVIIEARFCGPPDSGNGGYTAGLLAQRLGGTVEVTLRKPPPLERPLSLELTRERAELKDGVTLIAEARPAELDLELPPPPSFARALEQSAHYVGHQRHHFPTCFVCGPARSVHDGLRIFPGVEHAREPHSAPWVPDSTLANELGAVRPEIMWAALDCVGYFAAGAPDYPIALLGRMTACLQRPVEVAEKCVVLGWSLGREGRKLHAGTAVIGADGRVAGFAQQTWILLTPPS
jgi:hypothetical protein